MNERIAILGGAGFIGRSLASRLASSGANVYIFDTLERSSSLTNHLKKLLDQYPIRYDKLDVTSKADVTSKLENFDEIYNLAAINGTLNFYNNPLRVLEVGAVGAVNVAQSVIENKTPHYWIFSSSEVYGTPHLYPTPEDINLLRIDPKNNRHSYAAGKVVAEMTASYINKNLTSVKVIRPHNVYGPNMGTSHVIPEFIIKMKKMLMDDKLELTIQGSGMESRAYCYIEDFVDAMSILRLNSNESGTYNIGTEIETSTQDLIRELAVIFNIDFEDLIIRKQPLLEGSTNRRVPLITKIKSRGYQPKFSLAAGLRSFIEKDIDTKNFIV